MPLIRTAIERRSTPLASINNPATPLYQALTGLWDGTGSTAGPSVSNDTALGLTAVWRAISLIADLCSSLPLHVYREGADGARERVEPATARVLWDRPNPEQVPVVFWQQVFAHLVGWGNAYLYAARDGAGRVVELWPVHPGRVAVGRDGRNRKVYLLDGERERPLRDFPAGGEILHVPAMQLGRDGLTGLNPVKVFRNALGLGMATEEYGARLFSNGSLPGGILTTDQPMDASMAARYSAEWERYHRGLANAHKIAVLGNGLKYQGTVIPPEDAQFLAARSFQIEEVARIFGVPAHLLMDTKPVTSWGTGIEQQNRAFLQYTVQWPITAVEQTLSKTLLTGHGQGPLYAKFETGALLRADTLQRYQAYQVAVLAGIMTPNEARALEDLPPLPGGDDLLRPANMQDAGALPDAAQEGTGDGQGEEGE